MEKKIDWILVIIIAFGGWLGLDKLYKGPKENWKMCVIKFLANIILIGEVWNIYDLVMCFLGKYEIDPRAYIC